MSWHIFHQKLPFFPNPEQVFHHLFGTRKNNFWLDSSRVETGLSRFSFMGDSQGEDSLVVRYDMAQRTLHLQQNQQHSQIQGSIFDYLRDELQQRHCAPLDLPFDFQGGFVGYFAYELQAECLPTPSPFSSHTDDAYFIFANRLIVFDHQTTSCYLLFVGQNNQHKKADNWFQQMGRKLEQLPVLLPITPIKNQTEFSLQRDKTQYLQDIQDCLAAIQAGESYQLCLTNQLHRHSPAAPLAFYRQLRQKNPAPYAAFLQFEHHAIACSSPECFLRITPQGAVESKPIKGTVPRGKTAEKDQYWREYLLNNEKERAENVMIVDLLRNDLGKVCEIGSVHVPKLLHVESYATVHQLVSTIRGQLRADIQAIDCIQSAFPGGSMTGAPKIKSVEILQGLEKQARGIYSGSLGFLGLNGSAELNIVIRSAVFTATDTYIGVGGGITALSDPETEFAEICLKAKALI